MNNLKRGKVAGEERAFDSLTLKKMKISSAFDQFEIVRLVPLHLFGNMDISITNSTIFMLLAILTWQYLIKINIVDNGTVVPHRWQSVIELVYENIFNIVKQNIGKEGYKYFPFILTLFVWIALMNLYGVVPYTFSPTSHIIVTFGLSLSIFLGVTLLGFVNHATDYFAMFLPAGSPMWLAPFLVIIEFISHGAKAVSLGVRLAANITAGHLLFGILSGFCWTMLTTGGFLAVLSIFPLFIVLFITVLEMGVAVVQAYVFCVLTSIYINDSIHLH